MEGRALDSKEERGEEKISLSLRRVGDDGYVSTCVQTKTLPSSNAIIIHPSVPTLKYLYLTLPDHSPPIYLSIYRPSEIDIMTSPLSTIPTSYPPRPIHPSILAEKQ